MCIVTDVSYVTRIKYASHFAWEADYLVRLEGDANHFACEAESLVRLEGDTCCSAHCIAPRNVNHVSCVTRIYHHESHSAWQAQYLVTPDGFICDEDQS